MSPLDSMPSGNAARGLGLCPATLCKGVLARIHLTAVPFGAMLAVTVGAIAIKMP